jgi:glyoxylase-like metal-dependent hydrolase (beta-lactamase superfamily II)
MEIAPGIHRIICRFGRSRMVFVHLLIGDHAAMLVDTGVAHNPQQEILPYMQSIGFDPADLTYILITHSDLDHQGGNQPMKDAAPQALLTCHYLDRPWIEDTDALIKGRYSQFEADHGIGYGEAGKDGIRASTLSTPVDLTLSGGEQFRLSDGWYVEAVHTPGHSWGHTTVYDPRSKTLISGEATMGTHIPNEDWSPGMPPTYCYVDTYEATQNQLLTMDIETLASSHWQLKQGPEVREFIQESKNYCLHVEQTLLNYARSGRTFTLREAIDTLGQSLGEWSADTNQDFSYGMLGNLDRLTKRGLLRTSRNGEGHIEWSAV